MLNKQLTENMHFMECTCVNIHNIVISQRLYARADAFTIGQKASSAVQIYRLRSPATSQPIITDRADNLKSSAYNGPRSIALSDRLQQRGVTPNYGNKC